MTPQGIEPHPDNVRSATTGVFCFFVIAVIWAKAKPEGTEFVPPGKENPKHLAATLSCHHMGISLDHEAETRRQKAVSPFPSISPQ